MEAGGPSPPDPYPYREPGGGQASPGQRQAWLEVQYERDNAVQTDPGAGSSSLADYLALSSGVRVAEFVPGTALAEGEMRLAMGGFDAARFEEYNRQMDLEMQQRADQRAYDSDQEREEQAAELMSHQALTAEQQATQEQERQDKQDLMALLQQTWEEQDSWMDEYRTRLGPQEGYQELPQGSRSTQSSPGGQGQQLLGDMRSPSPSLPGHQPLSPSDEALVDGSFMPLLSPGLVAEGYVSEGPDGYVRRPQGGGGGLRPAGRQRPFTPTVPEPMAFEERAAARPKPIRTVKLEQDLAIKQQEEQAARHWRHKARPVPDAVLDQRYQQMLLEAEVRRQINRDTRLAELASMVEQPFSFQERDEQRKMMQEAIAARAKDPNRFQQHFHAKPVPTAVKIEKFKFMQMELEAKRAAARARMEEARALARQRLQQDVDHRQDNAKRQYQERLRSIDPIWNQKYDTKPPGAVPDFNMMHSKWEQRMATMRALNRRHMTVPQEFGTHTARTPAELKDREAKASGTLSRSLQRRQRILLEMQADEELLPESRWPFKSLRGRVQPQPPPAFTQPDHKVSDTRANMLRRAKTHQARRQGQFDDPEDKERKALLRARTEAEERAKVYMALKTKQAYGKPSSSSMPTCICAVGVAGAGEVVVQGQDGSADKLVRSGSLQTYWQGQGGSADKVLHVQCTDKRRGIVKRVMSLMRLSSSGQDPGAADENAQFENEPRRSKAEQRELIKANTAVPVQHVEARHAQVSDITHLDRCKDCCSGPSDQHPLLLLLDELQCQS
ncbi:hypothetical protein QJQ45_010810 [Haematococcus lacustris]|nr:hypothetical protein QJQ45_010810 [Haematococcus lacustris]